MDCRLAFIKDREGGGRTEGGVSEREEETDVETETDRYRQANRQTDREYLSHGFKSFKSKTGVRF